MINRISVLNKNNKKLILPIALLFILGFFFIASMSSSVVGYTNQDDDDTNTSENEQRDDEEKDDDDDGIEDDEEEMNERELNFETNPEEVKIESQLKNGESKDEIHLELKVVDEPEIKLEYESEAGSAEIELKFTIKFYSLIEYVDLDLDGIFNESQDNLIQEINLDQAIFSPIQFRTEPLSSNATLYIINATTNDNVFSLQFYITNEFSIVNDALITPTEMKIDIGINNFAYINDASDLALKIRLEAENEYEHDEETEDEDEGRSSNEEEVEVVMNGFTGFFSWSEFVIVDGSIKAVKSSPVTNDDMNPSEQKIYLNYPRGQHILHDPKVGITNILLTPRISGTPGFLSPIALLVFALISGFVTTKRRKR